MTSKPYVSRGNKGRIQSIKSEGRLELSCVREDFMCKITKCRMCELYNCKSQCGGRFVIACMSRLSVGPYKYPGDQPTGGQSFSETLYSFGWLLVTCKP
jgi:hypothetical protein